MLPDNELILIPLSNLTYCRALYNFRSAITERAYAILQASDESQLEKDWGTEVIMQMRKIDKAIKDIFNHKGETKQ